jgi:hypothetical protein
MANIITMDANYPNNPQGTENLSEADNRMREDRQAFAERLAWEHKAIGDINALQGQHRQGSAVTYTQTSAPTTKPDGITALDVNDYGRLWYNTTAGVETLYIYKSTGWSIYAPNTKGTTQVFYQALAPTTDVNGVTLSTQHAGALWIRSTDKVLFFWSGTVWSDIAPTPSYTDEKAPQIFCSQTTYASKVIEEVTTNKLTVHAGYTFTFADGYFLNTTKEKNYSYTMLYSITPEAYFGGSSGVLGVSINYGLWASYDNTKVDTTDTAVSATSTTIVLANSAAAVDDYYNNGQIYIVSGTGAGQTKTINNYTGASRTCDVSAWTTPPDSTSVYYVMAGLSFIAYDVKTPGVTYLLGVSTNAAPKSGGNMGWDKPAAAAQGLQDGWFWYQVEENKTYRYVSGGATWVAGFYCFIGTMVTDGSKNITTVQSMVPNNYLVFCSNLLFIVTSKEAGQYYITNHNGGANTYSITGHPHIDCRIKPLYYFFTRNSTAGTLTVTGASLGSRTFPISTVYNSISAFDGTALKSADYDEVANALGNVDGGQIIGRVPANTSTVILTVAVTSGSPSTTAYIGYLLMPT